MTRITTQMVSRNVLRDINANAARVDALRTKASSGKEITRPSDDPYGAARALKLRETLDGIAQHKRNAEDAAGWQVATESALEQMTSVVSRIRELTVRGATETVDSESRDAIAVEVAQLAEALKEQANASYAGRYVFGGTDTTAPPYGAATGDAYQGNAGTVARELGPGVSVQINLNAGDVLGSAAGDGGLLDVVRSVQARLDSDDTAGLQASLGALDDALDGLLAQRAANGATTERGEAAIARLDQYAETTIRQLSITEDADFAKTLIDLNSQQAAYQAALRAGANIVQASLMDFLR